LVEECKDEARIFTFGVGNSVSHGFASFLDAVAMHGRGTSNLTPNEDYYYLPGKILDTLKIAN